MGVCEPHALALPSATLPPLSPYSNLLSLVKHHFPSKPKYGEVGRQAQTAAAQQNQDYSAQVLLRKISHLLIILFSFLLWPISCWEVFLLRGAHKTHVCFCVFRFFELSAQSLSPCLLSMIIMKVLSIFNFLFLAGHRSHAGVNGEIESLFSVFTPCLFLFSKAHVAQAWMAETSLGHLGHAT